MLDLRRFKDAIVSYGIHLPFVKQMLNSWLVCNRIIPKDWIELVKGVLEPGPQLQWSTWFREEAKIIEQQSKARGMEISQDQILGEGDYAAVETQSSPYDGCMLALRHAAALKGKELET